MPPPSSAARSPEVKVDLDRLDCDELAVDKHFGWTTHRELSERGLSPGSIARCAEQG